jgi:hypothetical protein
MLWSSDSDYPKSISMPKTKTSLDSPTQSPCNGNSGTLATIVVFGNCNL